MKRSMRIGILMVLIGVLAVGLAACGKDNTDYENLFHNNQIKEVYNVICDKNAKKNITYGKGIVDYVESGLYNRITGTLKSTTSANIKTKLDSYKKSINAPIKQANKALKRMK